MKSLSLKIKMNQTNVPCRRIAYGGWQFPVNGFSVLPLKVVKRRLLKNLCVLTFDYQYDGFLSFISVSVNSSSVMSRNIAQAKTWTSFSIDLTAYQKLIDEQILVTYRKLLRILVAPSIASESKVFKIRNIRLRAKTADEEAKASLRQEYQDRLLVNKLDPENYLYNQSFPHQLTLVEASADEIRFEGAVSVPVIAPLVLCELPVFCDFVPSQLDEIVDIVPDKKAFICSIPRMTERYGPLYDRIYSRWVLAYRFDNQLYVCSSPRYSDAPRTGYIFPAFIPRTKKGLGGYKQNRFSSDLADLGISFITFNIRINNFLRLKPGPDNFPFEYNGKTYYANIQKIQKYDQAILCAAQYGINVSAIILVYPELWSRDQDVGRMLEHPEYERGGVYTMPNLTNPDSAHLYAAAIDFLAARYNRPDGKYGRIHRWIVHNEVDTGRVWTNAGNKSAFEFMELYIKSMRLIYYTARKYDAGAEVLISLDHFWNEKNNEPNCYPSLQILRILLDYCKVEGDFEWGVAIHPYPESLLEPKSWLDTSALHVPDTPLITFKNLEVLDEWIQNPETFYLGRKRSLLLSEQNPNSLDYTPLSLWEQAAGLAYAWKKTEACTGVDAYIAHSWIDARFEGGLKTGLRRYPDDPKKPYGLKPSWFVFRDAGTSREDEAFAFAKSIIGISDWQEIIQPMTNSENSNPLDNIEIL